MGRTTSVGFCLGLIALVGLLCVTRAMALREVPAVAKNLVPSNGNNADALSLTSAALDSDPDADSLLNRAHEYIGLGQYREALLLLQHVADNYGDALCEGRGGVFIPARRAVEQVIAHLPEQGLNTYRLNVDGRAKGLVGGDVYRCRDSEALRQVVDKYFISSIGDDAAYVLACWLMDRGEPAAACELLRRIVREHPDPSIDRQALYARTAVAAARSRSRATMADALARLERLSSVSPQVVSRTMAMTDAITTADATERRDRWTHAWGSPDRGGVMPALRHGNLRHKQDTLAVLWQFESPIKSGYQYWGGLRNNNGVSQSRPTMIDRWRSNRWLPTTQVLFVDGRLFYKTHDALICRDAQTGERLWGWKQNKADETRTYGYLNNHNNLPSTIEELLLFGDQIGKSLSVVDGVVYHVAHHQGAAWPDQYDRQNANARRQPLVRGNALVALDITTGKPIWQRGRSGRAEDSLKLVRFLTPPVPGPGDTVLTVVDREGELSFVALSRTTGQIVWDRFLCAQGLGTPQWSPVAISVVGDQAFIVPGYGLVFSTDAYTGRINWVSRYPRSTPKQTNSRSTQQTTERNLGIRGWRDNAVFVSGGAVAVAPWDAEVLLLLDRQSGAPLMNPQTGQQVGLMKIDQPRYCLGMIDDKLIYARGDELVARDIQTGAVAWKALADQTTGRAAITEDAIYMPAGDRVVQIDPAGGKLLAYVRCVTPHGDPVGNLYCDGSRLLSVGLNQAYALVEGEHYLADLNERIDGGANASAYLARAHLKDQLNRHEAAVEDYRLAYRSAAKDEVRDEARQKLFESLLAMAERDTANTERWLDATQQLIEELPVTDTLAERQRVLFARAEHLGGAGQADRAMAMYLRVIDEGRESGSDARLGMNDPHGTWSAEPRVFAVNAVDRLVEGGDPRLADMVETRASAALAEAQALETVAARYQALGRVAFDYPRSGAGLLAIDTIGVYDEHVSLERVEQVLLRLSASGHTRSASAASAALAGLFEQVDWPYQARDQWRRFADRFADLQLGDEAAPLTGAQLAEQQIATLAIDKPAASYREMAPPPWKKLWEVRGGYNNLVLDLAGDDGSQFLRSHVFILFRNTSTLQCYSADATSLSDPVWKLPVPRNVTNSFNYYNANVAFGGVVGGHVMVFHDGRRLLAYGLVSGKKLWEIETEATGQRVQSHVIQQQRQQGVMSLALDDGVLLRRLVTDDLLDQVIAHDAVTGEVLWQRTFNRTSVPGVAICGGYAVILTENAKRLLVCDRFSGRVIREIELAGYNSGQRLLWADGYVIYYRNGNAISIDLTTGQTVWEQSSSGNYQALNDRLFYTQDRQGNLVVRPLGPGEVIATIERSKFGISFHDVAINRAGTELFCIGYDNKGQRALSIMDIEKGERKQLIQFGKHHYTNMPAATLANAGEYIPWVTRHEENGRTSDYKVVFYRKSTGELYTEHTLPTSRTNGRFQYYIHRPPQIVGNMLVVATNRGISAFGADKPDAVKQEKPFDGTHTVKAGDSLYSISKKYYGDGNQWKKILEANKDTLESPDRLKVGQKLVIPPAPKTEKPEEAAAAKPLRTSMRVSISNAGNGSAKITATGNIPAAMVLKEVERVKKRGIDDIKVVIETGDDTKDKAITKQVDDLIKKLDAEKAKREAVEKEQAARAAQEAAVRAKLEAVRRAAAEEAEEEPAE